MHAATASCGQHEARQSYSPSFSSIIVDGNSAPTLQANNPDATVTRFAHQIMTLYLLFSASTPANESRHRNGSVGSRFRAGANQTRPQPGQTIKVERCDQGLVTRSANRRRGRDCRSIAGDEDGFAKLMTRKARASA